MAVRRTVAAAPLFFAVSLLGVMGCQSGGAPAAQSMTGGAVVEKRVANTGHAAGASDMRGGLPDQPTPPADIVVADFNQPGWRTNLGDPFGTWDHDPDDPTQFCRARLVQDPRLGKTGYSLMMDYDVDSPNPAFNGFWMKLPSLPLERFRTLSLAIKGDPNRGFTRRVKLELKGKRRAAAYVLDGISTEWTTMRIPLRAFRDIEQVRTATEFVIVFDDQTVTEKIGTLYLDKVTFEAAL